MHGRGFCQAQEGRPRVEISTDSASLRKVISGAFKFLLSCCPFLQPPVIPSSVFLVHSHHTTEEGGSKGKKKSFCYPWLGSSVEPIVFPQPLLGFYSFVLDSGHLTAGAKPCTVDRGEPDRRLGYSQPLPVLYLPSNHFTVLKCQASHHFAI